MMPEFRLSKQQIEAMHRLNQSYEETRRSQWPEVVFFVRQPDAGDKIEKAVFSAVWPYAKLCKMPVDPKGKPTPTGRFLVEGFNPESKMFLAIDGTDGHRFAFPVLNAQMWETLVARFRFWAEAVPEHVRRLAAKLREQGRDGPDDVEDVLAAVKPLFAKLDPFPDSGDVALLHAFGECYRADALAALERAAVETLAPSSPWNGKTVGRLTVEKWGQRILWKPMRAKKDYKTPERIPFDFNAPRVWAGLALILANGGGWTDMEEEQKQSGCKTKWKDVFRGADLKRLRDTVFESKPQDTPGETRGQFWKLKD